VYCVQTARAPVTAALNAQSMDSGGPSYTDGLIGMAASGWISLHKIWKYTKYRT